MNNKIIERLIIFLIIFDVVHYLIFRFNYEASGELYYELDEVSYIKWGLMLLVSIGLIYYRKNKYFNYLTLISSLCIVYLFIYKGPFVYFLLWYSAIYFWIIFILSFYLFILSLKTLLKK
jgi:hypothetical protein